MASSSKLLKHDSLLSHPHNKASDAIARPQTQPQPQPQPPPPPPRSATSHGVLSPSQEDVSLAASSVLTRPELFRRRLHRLRQLSRVYRDHYWALMEEVRVQYREYYWKYGISPYKEDDERESGGGDRDREFNGEGCGESNNNINNNNNNNSNGVSAGGNGGKLGLGLGLGFGEDAKLGGNNRCAFVGCKLKAMALTSFCHLHILSDPEQKLYKACNFVIKSAQAGPILCGKPILRSTIPSLCNIHFQKAQKHATRALKKAGLNVSASSKLAPKFHVVIAEYVNQIQSKRRAVQKAGGENIAIKEESMS